MPLQLLVDRSRAPRQKKFQLRLRRATFRATKVLEQSDFERLPKLNRTLEQELGAGRYLDECVPGPHRRPLRYWQKPSRPGTRPLRHPPRVDVLFTTCAQLTAS